MFHQIKKLSQDHWPLFLLGNVSSLANLFLPIALVRILSPEDVGLYKTFFLYLMVLPFVALAGGPVNSVYYWAGSDKNRANEYIKQSWLATLFLSSFILAIGACVFIFFKASIPFSSSAYWMLIAVAFLACPSGHFGEVCIARGQILQGTLLSLSFELIKVFGFIYVAWHYRNIFWLFSFFLILMILSFLFMTTLAAKNHALTFRAEKKKFREVLRYSLPISLSSGLFFLTDRADQIILSALISPESFAFYSLGCLMVPPLLLLETSVQKVLIPKLTSNYLTRDFQSMRFYYRKAITDIAYLMIPAVFGLFFFSGPIVELLFTKEYQASSLYLQIFAFSYLFLMLPHDSILRASGHTNIVLKLSFLGVLLTFGGLYLSAKFLTPAWVLSLSLVFKLVPKLYCLNHSARLIESKIRELIPWKNLLKFFLVSSALTLVSYGMRPFFENQVNWLLVTMPGFAILYLGTLTLMDRPKYVFRIFN